MCCTITIGGMGGRNSASSRVSAGGPPVDMPSATHLSASSSGQASAAGFTTGRSGNLTTTLRLFREAIMRRTSTLAAPRILEINSSPNA